jgi:hypothetical protein
MNCIPKNRGSDNLGRATDPRFPYSHRFSLLLSAIALVPWMTLYGQVTGSIDGVVRGDQGVPVAGATILYGRLATTTTKGLAMLPPVNTGFSDATGSFSFGNLAPATYLVCIQVPADTYLDPCHWSKTPPTFTVAAGQSVHGAIIDITRGVSIPVTVADPLSLFAQEGVAPNAHLTVGVIALSGVLHPARINNGATGRTYTITIPFDTPTNLFIATGAFSMTDAAGKGVSSGGQTMPVTVPSVGVPPNLSFTLQAIGKP